jgi:transcriptional regulator with XRE-family HTH domain
VVEYLSTMATSTKRTAKVVGRQVERLRNDAKLTRPALARKLGVNRTHVWRIETGGTLPSLDLLDRMARLFDVTLDELRGRVEAA